MKRKYWPICFALLMGLCASSYAETLTLREDPETAAIRVFREGGDVAILTQNADLSNDSRRDLQPKAR